LMTPQETDPMRIAFSGRITVRKAWLLVPLLVCGVCSLCGPSSRADESQNAAVPSFRTQFRVPVALALIENESLLFTANRRSGTVSVIDTATNKLVAEQAVGGMLSDLAVTPRGRFLIATDEARHQLVLLERTGRDVKVLERLDVSAYPVTVTISDDGSRCFVASLWSRRLTVVDLVQNSGSDKLLTAKVARTMSLSFAPRAQLWMAAAKRLVVADSFSEKFAVIDPEKDQPESVRLLPGHNVRGLHLGPESNTLLVSHQILHHRGRTNNADVHWGLLMTNILRILSLDAVLKPEGDLLKGSHSVLLGDVGRAGADPGAIALGPDGRYVVAVSGVGAVTVV
jgi:YVTN family beta-propeller protein